MSDDFQQSQHIRSTRKIHVCEQCGRYIEVGFPASYLFGKCDGCTYSTYQHIECDAAARAYAELNDLWGEEYPWFQHMDDTDHYDWLAQNHPVVAARLNISAPETTASTGSATA